MEKRNTRITTEYVTIVTLLSSLIQVRAMTNSHIILFTIKSIAHFFYWHLYSFSLQRSESKIIG
jgi:hypothetical protein